jgi:hypothetical protein
MLPKKNLIIILSVSLITFGLGFLLRDIKFPIPINLPVTGLLDEKDTSNSFSAFKNTFWIDSNPIDANGPKDNYYYFGKVEGYYPTDTSNFAIWLTRGHPSQGGWTGKFRYDNVPNMQDSLKGELINNKFELKNSYENPIEIDTISKTGFITIGNKKVLILEEFVPDPKLPNINPVIQAMEYKSYTLVADPITFDCYVQGKLEVGQCQIKNKYNFEVNKIDVFGFPEVIFANQDYIEFKLDKRAYGVCDYTKYRINNKSYELQKLKHYESCNSEFFKAKLSS